MSQRNNANDETERGQPEDAITMLKEDHRRVRDLFQAYEAATDPQAKRERAEAAFVALDIHALLEEQVFYPAVDDDTTTQGAALVQESFEAHQTIKRLIQALRDMGPSNTQFDATFHELVKHVDHHMEEEESALFPLAQEELGEDMENLLEEMQELKEDMLAS